VIVYWDTLFSSFMFVPATLSPHLQVIQHGRVVDSAGKPKQRVPVDLSYKGKVFHTFTNSKGEYSVYGNNIGAPAAAMLMTEGQRINVSIGAIEESTVHVP
jgi:hypothetical protein